MQEYLSPEVNKRIPGKGRRGAEKKTRRIFFIS